MLYKYRYMLYDQQWYNFLKTEIRLSLANQFFLSCLGSVCNIIFHFLSQNSKYDYKIPYINISIEFFTFRHILHGFYILFSLDIQQRVTELEHTSIHKINKN